MITENEIAVSRKIKVVSLKSLYDALVRVKGGKSSYSLDYNTFKTGTITRILPMCNKGLSLIQHGVTADGSDFLSFEAAFVTIGFCDIDCRKEYAKELGALYSVRADVTPVEEMIYLEVSEKRGNRGLPKSTSVARWIKQHNGSFDHILKYFDEGGITDDDLLYTEVEIPTIEDTGEENETRQDDSDKEVA